jgi:thiol-disulfide isomerase/thioredoxin
MLAVLKAGNCNRPPGNDSTLRQGSEAMDTIALVNSQAPDRPGLSPAVRVGVAVLAVITILLTWRAGVLETTLEQQDEQPALVGSAAPDFSALALDGRTVALADFRGQKKVVVAFWASWCGPCRMEMPSLVKFYKENHTDSSDFELLAVSIDEDTKAAEGFAAVEKLMFPVLLAVFVFQRRSLSRE